MTQYKDKVEKQQLINAAEAWGNQISDIHAFNTKQVTMWYDTRLDDGNVIDIRYNNGKIERTLSTGRIVWIGEQYSRKSMIERFSKVMEDIRSGVRQNR